MGRVGSQQVLADHQRIGKRFTPPLLRLGDFHEVSWIKVGIPETIWLALCHSACRPQEAVSIGEKIVEVLRYLLPEEHQFTTFSVSNLGGVPQEYRDPICFALAGEGLLFTLQRLIEPLVLLYPECPLIWLWTTPPAGESQPEMVSRFKGVLVQQFDKTTKEAMFVQTTLVHLGFASGRLRMVKDLTLGKYPSVQDYPLTQESRLAAASVRATVLQLFNPDSSSPRSAWPAYFWNRGLDLEPCETPDEFPFLDYYAQSRIPET